MPAVDEEGYLVDPEQWTPKWATEVARTLDLALNDDHWEVVHFIRESFQERQVTPDARHAMRHLELRYPERGRHRMFELFPFGHVAQACRIAGMKRPAAWSTG